MTTAGEDMMDRFPTNVRTHLNEIVEEETRPACDGVLAPRGGYLHRIAERAFRHGAERAYATNLEAPFTYKSVPWIFDIKPAPAEEKKIGLGCILAYKNKDGFFCPDRRKGERRKGFEMRVNRSFCLNTSTDRGISCTSGTDRRSGDKRRKS